MINILKEQLNAEWNKPKAKNAKPGQLVRDEAKIQSLHDKINEAKQAILTSLDEEMIGEDFAIVDFEDYDLLGEEANVEPIILDEGSEEL